MIKIKQNGTRKRAGVINGARRHYERLRPVYEILTYFPQCAHFHRGRSNGGCVRVGVEQPVVLQHAAEQQPVRGQRGAAGGDGRGRAAAVAAGLLRRRQGGQVHAAHVLHLRVHNLRGDAGERHHPVRVPREGVHVSRPGDVRVHPLLRREARVHAVLGPDADAAAVLRGQELQGLERQRAGELLQGGLPGQAHGLQVVAEPVVDAHGGLPGRDARAAANQRRVGRRRRARRRRCYVDSTDSVVRFVREDRVIVRLDFNRSSFDAFTLCGLHCD